MRQSRSAGTRSRCPRPGRLARTGSWRPRSATSGTPISTAAAPGFCRLADLRGQSLSKQSARGFDACGAYTADHSICFGRNGHRPGAAWAAADSVPTESGRIGRSSEDEAAMAEISMTGYLILGILSIRDTSAYEIVEQMGKGVSEV